MFDRGDLAIGNVRIDRQLRRRRNGSGNRGACHRGNDGPHGDAGNINIVANVNCAGNVDVLGNAGHVGNVGNVRLRLEQHCFIVDADVNGADRAGRWRSNRNSVGFLRDWQSWG
jgi:hypothetical protein